MRNFVSDVALLIFSAVRNIMGGVYALAIAVLACQIISSGDWSWLQIVAVIAYAAGFLPVLKNPKSNVVILAVEILLIIANLIDIDGFGRVGMVSILFFCANISFLVFDSVVRLSRFVYASLTRQTSSF